MGSKRPKIEYNEEKTWLMDITDDSLWYFILIIITKRKFLIFYADKIPSIVKKTAKKKKSKDIQKCQGEEWGKKTSMKMFEQLSSSVDAIWTTKWWCCVTIILIPEFFFISYASHFRSSCILLFVLSFLLVVFIIWRMTFFFSFI